MTEEKDNLLRPMTGYAQHTSPLTAVTRLFKEGIINLLIEMKKNGEAEVTIRYGKVLFMLSQNCYLGDPESACRRCPRTDAGQTYET
jgi:7-cyano-7-deazaguanine synthase in queuosine biosynthesis